MSEFSEQRRLTTIVAADIVGYSRLMAENESGVLAQLRALYRELVEPKTAEYRGRIVKLMGDGLLIEFGSVVDAVKFAFDFQTNIFKRNNAIPEELQLHYRIGINIGDMIVENEDIYGDGVNLASRLEAFAQPGTVCLSGAAFEQVNNKVPYSFKYLGMHQFKNMAQSVPVYELQPSTDEANRKRPSKFRYQNKIALVCLGLITALIFLGWGWFNYKDNLFPGDQLVQTSEGLPTVLILPFNAFSESSNEKIFADALTEDIIADLTRFSGLRVLGRRTSFAQRKQQLSRDELVQKLGVRYLLEGSIQRADNRIRISAQLVRAKSDVSVWANKYDKDFTDILSILDDVTSKVVGTLVSQIGRSETQRTLRRKPEDLEAHAITLRGRRLWQRSRKKSIPQARELLLQAVQKYPDYAPAYVYLAFTYLTAFNNKWSEEFESPTNMPRMADLARQALLIDDSYALAHATRAVALIYQGLHEEGYASAIRALDLNPNNPDALGRIGQVFNFYGENERAINILLNAIELDPFAPAQWRNFLSRAYFFSGQYEKAALVSTACIERAPIEPCHVTRIASLGHLKKSDAAKKAIADYKQINSEANVETSVARLRIVFRRSEDIPRLEKGLRLAGLEDG